MMGEEFLKKEKKFVHDNDIDYIHYLPINWSYFFTGISMIMVCKGVPASQSGFFISKLPESLNEKFKYFTTEKERT